MADGALADLRDRGHGSFVVIGSHAVPDLLHHLCVEPLRDRLFWNAFRNTALYSLHVPIGMAVSLGIALLMNRKIRGVNFLRTLFFLPSISSFVAIAMVWQWMYHPQFGLANHILRIFGMPQSSWLSDPSTALISIMVMSIWLGLGYQMVIFLAGLQGIPKDGRTCRTAPELPVAWSRAKQQQAKRNPRPTSGTCEQCRISWVYLFLLLQPAKVRLKPTTTRCCYSRQ